MLSAADAVITVVYPVVDVRGAAAGRVRSWTLGQRLARKSYRVLVGVDDAAPAPQTELAALLAPHDGVISLPDATNEMLWNAGAERAGTPWLVFTEGHCVAEPGCLDATRRWIAANPQAEAGNFAVSHPDNYLMAQLSKRWFDGIHARWEAPDAWPRLHRAGFAIRADIFKAVGGFPHFGQFSVPLLSARLHERGVKVANVPDAAVIHIDDDSMEDHHADTADFVRGECAARAQSDPVFFERYFGYRPIYANQLRERRDVARRMLAAVLAAARARPQRAAGVAALIPPLTLAATTGIPVRVTLQRLAIQLDEFAVERLPLPPAWRWARFLRAHSRVVDLTLREWINEHATGPTALPPDERRSVDQLGPEQLVGVHALQQHDGIRFRWSKPVVLLRLNGAGAERTLRIETGGILRNPLARIAAVVIDGAALPQDAVSTDDEDAIKVRLPPGHGTETEVAIVCSPLIPALSGLPGRRLLGLPIVAIASNRTGAG